MYLDSIRAKFIRIHRDFEQDDTERITAEAVINRFSGQDTPLFLVITESLSNRKIGVNTSL